MKTNLLLLFAILALTTTNQLNAQIEIEEYKLENGLTVILHEDHSKPEVFGVVAVKAGGKNDPEDATGMAHYQEHMLFKGTQELGTIDWERERPIIEKIFSLYDQLGNTADEEKRKEIQQLINKESLKAAELAIPNETSNLIKSIGGTNLNAGTGPDMTLYYNAFPPNQMGKWLELYSHRFENPVFRSFQAELEVVYEEKNLYNDMFIFPILEEFNKNFFKKHPYGQQTLIGTMDDLKNPSLTKMYEFYKTYYVANNMSLILVGDFDTKTVKPLIEEKFGKWQSSVLPEQKKYDETDFKGRELVEVKMSPIKLGFLGYRSPQNGHEDEIAFEICNGILSNENGSGLIDKLSLDNKLMAAQILPMTYNDYGCNVILIVPKILGQKLEEAEQLILTELENLKNGKFDEWMVEAIKLELYKNYHLSMESNEWKAQMIASAFGQNRPVQEMLSYPSKLKAITKEDVIRVAKKYYGDNYLAFFSKMGFPKKDKMDKPGYEPLVANTNAKSIFAEKFEKIKSADPEKKFIDFANSINTHKVGENYTIYATKNEKNDIFSLTMKFGIGHEKLPLLKYASEIMNYCGTKSFKIDELKKEFSKIGCSYQIYSDKSYTYLYVDGQEQKLNQALELISQLITVPELDPEKLKIIIDGEKTNRKMESSEPDNVADALFDYVRYDQKSPYIDRLPIKDIKNLNPDKLVETFQEATKYELEIHICLKENRDAIANNIRTSFTIPEKFSKSQSPIVHDPIVHDKNKIYFVHKGKALQSKVFLFINGTEYNLENDPVTDAFNLYFGGGFSGIVLQEIREYRSMAYSAGAWYTSPKLKGKQTSFIGYVGTQSDKTNEAIDIFVDLIRNMPEKSERIDMIKPYLIQSAITNKPEFRDLSEKILEWKLKGYEKDPAEEKILKYENLKFNDILSFYDKNIQAKPLVICIVGNKKRIDLKSLEKYGEIIKVKEKKIFTN